MEWTKWRKKECFDYQAIVRKYYFTELIRENHPYFCHKFDQPNNHERRCLLKEKRLLNAHRLEFQWKPPLRWRSKVVWWMLRLSHRDCSYYSQVADCLVVLVSCIVDNSLEGMIRNFPEDSKCNSTILYIWYSRVNYTENLKRIGTFDTVEDFWR